MPAIQPARLRQQSAALAEHFKNPIAYVRSMHYLLDFYSDRAVRPGRSGRPGPLIQAYNVRPPVLRMLLQELLPMAEQDVQAALDLCDALWAETYLEFRQLAAMLLGQISPDWGAAGGVNVSSAITGRLQHWIIPSLELYLIELLLSTGVERLHRQRPQAVLGLIQSWLEQQKVFYQQLGLHALLPLIRDPNFENLPVFFRMIQPYCRVVSPALRPDILDVVATLAKRSPQETAYFLRQLLTHPEAPDTPWLIRQSLAAFPPELAESLRQAVRGAPPRPQTGQARSRPI
jgi:hypothetical protein